MKYLECECFDYVAMLLINCLQYADTEEHDRKHTRGKKVGSQVLDAACDEGVRRAESFFLASPVNDGVQLDYCRKIIIRCC